MNTPTALRGNLYPISVRGGCVRFSQCTLTKKCQNFDPSQADCVWCESRVRPASGLKGFLPEGEIEPDLQHAMHIMEQLSKSAFAHPDNEGKVLSSPIAEKHETARKIADVFALMQQRGDASMEEFLTDAYYDPEKRKLLGRLE